MILFFINSGGIWFQCHLLFILFHSLLYNVSFSCMHFVAFWWPTEEFGYLRSRILLAYLFLSCYKPCWEIWSWSNPCYTHAIYAMPLQIIQYLRSHLWWCGFLLTTCRSVSFQPNFEHLIFSVCLSFLCPTFQFLNHFKQLRLCFISHNKVIIFPFFF